MYFWYQVTMPRQPSLSHTIARHEKEADFLPRGNSQVGGDFVMIRPVRTLGPHSINLSVSDSSNYSVLLLNVTNSYQISKSE